MLDNKLQELQNNTIKLNKEILEFSSEINEVKDQVESISTIIPEYLSNKLVQNEELLNLIYKKIRKLEEAKINELSNQQNLHTKSDEITHSKELLITEIIELHNVIDSLSSEASEHPSKIKQFDIENEHVLKQIDSKQKEIEQKSSYLVEIQQNLSSLTAEIQHLTARIEENDKVNNQLLQENKSIADNMNDIEKIASDGKQKYESLKMHLSDLNNSLLLMKESLLNGKHSLLPIVQEYQTLKSKCDNAKQTLNDSESRQAQLRAEIEEIKQNLLVQKSNMSSTNYEFQQMTMTEAQIGNDGKSKLQKLNNLNNMITMKQNEFSSILEELKKEKNITMVINQDKAANHRTTNEIAQNEREIQNLQSTINELQFKIQNVKKQREASETLQQTMTENIVAYNQAASQMQEVMSQHSQKGITILPKPSRTRTKPVNSRAFILD